MLSIYSLYYEGSACETNDTYSKVKRQPNQRSSINVFAVVRAKRGDKT